MITEQIPELLIQFYLFQIFFNNLAVESEGPRQISNTSHEKDMTNQFGCENKSQRFTYDYQFFRDQESFFGYNSNAPIWLIFSMIIPFSKIPASTVSLEKAFRKLDPLTPKMSEVASCLLYFINILLIPSRLFLHAGLMHTTPNHFINIGYILLLTIVWCAINVTVISKNGFKCCEVGILSQVRKGWLLFLFSFRDLWVISLRDCTAYVNRPSEVS
jgi:hypothetical protein